MTDDTRYQGDDADDDVSELFGAYVLDALNDDERARVDERLAADPDARAEVDRLANAVDTALASRTCRRWRLRPSSGTGSRRAFPRGPTSDPRARGPPMTWPLDAPDEPRRSWGWRSSARLPP